MRIQTKHEEHTSKKLAINILSLVLFLALVEKR